MRSRFSKAGLILVSGLMVQTALAQEVQTVQQATGDSQSMPVVVQTAPVAATAAQPAGPTPEQLAQMTPKQQEEAKLMVEPAYEAPAGMLFDEQAYLSGTTPLSDYTNVIVINKKAKGPGAQTMRMYTNRQLVLTTKVSTGQEGIEYVTPVAAFFRRFGKGAVKSHWRHTTRGFYTVKRIENADYTSGENNFHMPYAMFFNEDKGLAIHQAPPDIKGDEAELGHNVSSGCVRVSKDVILQIWNSVTDAGKGLMPVLDTKTGQQLTDSNGKPRFAQSYRSIVIVEQY